MAAGGQMAEFFATLGFNIKKGDIQKVDKQLDILENRARKISEDSLANIKVNISRFGFSDNFNTRLHKALKARMKVATNKGVGAEIKVSKFDIDRNELLREMRDAVRYVEQNLRVNIRPNINRPAMGGFGGRAGGGSASNFAGGMGAGAAAGSLGRGFIPGLGVAFGVSQLNNINQELVAQQYAAQAVFGSKEKGQEGLDWLRNLSNEVGMDYRSQGQPYIRMIASATNAGMGVGQTQDMYAGISRYGRTMGLGREDMKGSMRAVEQMLNKQQVYAEELKTQLAEKMPGVMSAMAEAVTGDRNNTKELFKLMESGEVSSIEYLSKFADILEKRAMEGGAYLKAIKSSAAEQGRFNNTFNDMVKEFSKAGFEEGQAGIFRTMSAFFREMLPLVQGFGEAWQYVESVLRIPLGLLVDLSTGIEKLSEYTGLAKGNLLAMGGVVALLAFPLTRMFTIISGVLFVLEDFTAFLTGRGSVIGQFLKNLEESNPKQFAETVAALKGAFESIAEAISMSIEGWKLLLGLMSDQSAMGVVLDMLTTAANEVKAAVDSLLLLTGKKDPNEQNTHFGENEGPISYAMKGITRQFKEPVQTMTSEQASTFVRSDKIATLFNRMRDIKHIENMGYTDDMSKQQLQDFRAYKDNVQTTERLIENTYKIQIDGTQNPEAVAREIERRVQELQQEQYKGASDKAANGSQ